MKKTTSGPLHMPKRGTNVNPINILIPSIHATPSFVSCLGSPHNEEWTSDLLVRLTWRQGPHQMNQTGREQMVFQQHSRKLSQLKRKLVLYLIAIFQSWKTKFHQGSAVLRLFSLHAKCQHHAHKCRVNFYTAEAFSLYLS